MCVCENVIAIGLNCIAQTVQQTELQCASISGFLIGLARSLGLYEINLARGKAREWCAQFDPHRAAECSIRECLCVCLRVQLYSAMCRAHAILHGCSHVVRCLALRLYYSTTTQRCVFEPNRADRREENGLLCGVVLCNW